MILKLRYVTLIQDGKITLSDDTFQDITYADDEQLIAAVTSLIADGFSFVDEPSGWPPAAILKELQKQDKLQTSFTAITWLGADQPQIYVVEKS